MFSRNDDLLASFADRLDAVAHFCGIRRLALRPDGRDAVLLIGEREGVDVAIQTITITNKQTK